MNKHTTHSAEEPQLVRGDAGLSLVYDGVEVRGDLLHMAPRLHPHRLNRELLVRAAKIKHADEPLLAVDATAGLGEDALLLAAAGFTVHLFERNATIAALLQDALQRAQDNLELASVVDRMRLHVGDSIQALPHLDFKPHVVLLDPMFPASRKSAAVKKKLQLLQQLEEPCHNEEELLQAALDAHPLKVVVKRPVKGPYLAHMKPSYSLSGKAIRYDCIVPPAHTVRENLE